MSVQKNNGPIIDPALCRCCRAIKKCRILTAEYNWMGKKEVYADMVMDCYGILLSHVDDNERDSGVCATCVVRLREAVAFRRQVLQCEELFLQAKLAPAEEETTINYENKLKKLELETIELKTEPKDYNSDHNSVGDDRDDPPYSDEEDNKPLKPETKTSEPLPLKDEDLKSEDSEDFNGSSSDSDEPIKKKTKRKKKTNGKEKEGKKKVKKQKADTEDLKTEDSLQMDSSQPDRTSLTEEIHIKDELQIEYSESDSQYSEVPEDTKVPEFRKRRLWVRDRSEGVSEYELLNCDNDEIYFEHMNMSKSSFEELHAMVELLIEKTDTNFRKCISTRERLAICLRLLRTGLSFKDISTKYRVGRTTVSKIVKDVSRALWSTLQPAYMPAPKEHTWRQAKMGYADMLKFPNCVGSIGGRHIIAKRIKEDSEYPRVSDKACHKRFVTIALIAVTDPHNKILALDIGNYCKDGPNILENSKFFSKYMEKRDFLPWTPLPGDTELTPHVLISNSFTTRYNLLRLFPKAPGYTPERRIFNHYLSQACTVDKTFDMLMYSWTILRNPMETHIDTAVAILKAICCLHNYVLTKHGTSLPFEPKNKKIKKLRKHGRKLNALQPFKPTNTRACNAAVAVRDRFLAYFNRLDPIQLDPITNDESETVGSYDQTESDAVTSLDNTVELEISNVCFNIKIEPSETNDSLDNALSDPIDSVENIVESNQPTGSVEIPVESLNSTGFVEARVESLSNPTGLVEARVESLINPTGFVETRVESNQPTGSVEITIEPNDSFDNSESRKLS